MSACSPAEFVEQALHLAHKFGRKKILLLGDAYYPYEEYFQKTLGEKMLVAAPHLMYPRAASIASLAMLKLETGELENLFSLRLLYQVVQAEYRLGKGAQ